MIRRLPPPDPAWARNRVHDWAWENTRLRDLRRLVALWRENAPHGGDEIRESSWHWGATELIVIAGAVRPLYQWRHIPRSPATHWQIGLAERVLDWLIGQYGPDASAADVLATLRRLDPELAQAVRDRQQHAAGDPDRVQADRTDHEIGEDAPISDGAHTADADAHGGDGNSGECDHAADTAANDRTASESTCQAGATGDTPEPAQEIERADADASNGGAPGESSPGGTPEPGVDAQPHAEQGGDCGTDEATASGMGSGADPASGEEGDHRDETPDASASPEAEDQSSIADAAADNAAADGASQGGSRSPVAGPTLAKISDVARIARSLTRLMADATKPDPSPLWDGRRVVRELVSRRYSMARMRRDVRAPKAVLVLYDMSGSCAWIADRTWGIAQALATRYSALLAAPTASAAGEEGTLAPEEIEGRSPIVRALRRHAHIWRGDAEGWRAVRAAGITHMLVFGDAHGIDGYLAASVAGIKVLMANPNPNIAPHPYHIAALAGYTEIAGDDIASAVEALTRRALTVCL